MNEERDDASLGKKVYRDIGIWCGEIMTAFFLFLAPFMTYKYLTESLGTWKITVVFWIIALAHVGIMYFMYKYSCGESVYYERYKNIKELFH
jgi:hypothetical protein